MNRLQQKPEENEPPLGPGDYFIVRARYDEWQVSTEMARFIEEILDADPRPRWIRFVDLAGSRIRARSEDVTETRQCTAEQRAAGRAFRRSLRQECRAERTWDEDFDDLD
jgi:hypothetical protein